MTGLLQNLSSGIQILKSRPNASLLTNGKGALMMRSPTLLMQASPSSFMRPSVVQYPAVNASTIRKLFHGTRDFVSDELEC